MGRTQLTFSFSHYAEKDDLLLGLAYDHDDRDLPIEIVESDEGGAFAAVTFAYDDRGRLIGETRVVTAGNTPEYDLTYTYDQGGNRIEKYDAETGLLTQYSYDLDDLNVYGSDNNRLMLTDTWDMGEEELLYTTFYYYNAWGNVDRVVVEHADSPGDYRALRFVYDSANRVQYLMGETWSGDNCETQDYTVTFITEFRYDSPRARYLVRKIDPASLGGGGAPYDVLSETWSDYDGDETYGDFSVIDDDPPTISTRAYEPGLATAVGGNLSTTDYYHGDLIGTNRRMTDANGASLVTFTYTAFGERICNDGAGGAGPCDSGDFERFAYAGAWGYQQHDFPNEAGDPRPWPIGDAPIALQHVGWRTYDPGLGRFLQRDPIGMGGGFNVYSYVHGNPCTNVDPMGLDVWESWESWPHKGCIVGPLPDGTYCSIDFGCNPHILDMIGAITIGGRGEVTVTPTRRPRRSPDAVTTPAGAQDLKNWAQGGSMYYHVFFFIIA